MAPTNPNSGCDQQQQWRRPAAARFQARDRHLEHICGNFGMHVVALPWLDRHSPMRYPQAAFEVLRRLRYRSLLSLSPQVPRRSIMSHPSQQTSPCRRRPPWPFPLCRTRALCLLPPAPSRTYPSAAASPCKRHIYLGFASRRILRRTLCMDNTHRVLLKGGLRGGRQ